MRKHVIAPIAAGVLLAVAGAAQSATKSTTFQVTANVTQNCVISAAPLAFAAFNGTNDLANSAPITVYCTSGTAFDVGLNGGLNFSAGLRRMAGAGSDYLSYNLYTTNAYSTVWDTTNVVSGTGAGMTTAQTLTVYGRLLASDNSGAVGAGSYADTVTATITY
jgi:spore coat protein U-like protein